MNNLLAAVSGNAETIGISIAFIILIVVMLWFVIGGKGKWWMKVPVIGFGLYISITMWFAMIGLLGWPTPSELPEKFRLHWVVIEEPDKNDPNSGGIYVWAEDITGKGSQKKEDPTWVDQYVKPYVLPLHGYSDDNGPRVYKLPYSRELHEQSMGIRGFLMKGGVYRGSMRGDGLPGEGNGNGEGNGQGRDGQGEGRPGGRGGSLSQEQVPHFYQLPPPKFPPKNEFGRQQ